MPENVIPGKNFEAWLNRRLKVHGERRLQAARKEMTAIAEDVIEHNPAYTGASAGNLSRGYAVMTRHHPAFGMTVGNKFSGRYDENLAGWQIIESARRKGSIVELSLVNNMWDPYLRLVEKGLAKYQTSDGHFVKNAWYRHLARR
jgi:hypothetical protein